MNKKKICLGLLLIFFILIFIVYSTGCGISTPTNENITLTQQRNSSTPFPTETSTVIFTPTLLPSFTPSPTFTSTPTPTLTPTVKHENWIAFTNADNVWVIRSDGSGLQQVTTKPSYYYGRLKWSPNGKYLGFIEFNEGGDYSLNLFDIDNQALTKLVSKMGGGFDWYFDSTRIIFDTPETNPLENDGLWIIDIQADQKSQFVKSNKSYPWMSGPEVSPDGRYVLFYVGCIEPQRVKLGLVNSADQSIFLSDTPGYINCRWKPDSMQIVCLKAIPAAVPQSTIVFLDVPSLHESSSIPKELQEATGDTPIWSPNGREITYISKGIINLLDIDSLNQKAITNGSYIYDWSSDGLSLLAQANGIVYAINVSTGEIRKIAEGSEAVWQPNNTFGPLLPIPITPIPTPLLINKDLTDPNDVIKWFSYGLKQNDISIIG
jgi:Tol biopolymer transport system component